MPTVEQMWTWEDGWDLSILGEYYPAGFKTCSANPGQNGCCTPGLDCLLGPGQPKAGMPHACKYLRRNCTSITFLKMFILNFYNCNACNHDCHHKLMSRSKSAPVPCRRTPRHWNQRNWGLDDCPLRKALCICLLFADPPHNNHHSYTLSCCGCGKSV